MNKDMLQYIGIVDEFNKDIHIKKICIEALEKRIQKKLNWSFPVRMMRHGCALYAGKKFMVCRNFVMSVDRLQIGEFRYEKGFLGYNRIGQYDFATNLLKQ